MTQAHASCILSGLCSRVKRMQRQSVFSVKVVFGMMDGCSSQSYVVEEEREDKLTRAAEAVTNAEVPCKKRVDGQLTLTFC